MQKRRAKRASQTVWGLVDRAGKVSPMWFNSRAQARESHMHVISPGRWRVTRLYVAELPRKT